MPLQTGKDTEGCFIKWGDQGAKYHYICGDEQSREAAKKKAITQAVVIGDLASEKISFDYDETLTKQDIQDKAKQYIDNGATVYIISARHNAGPIYRIADELGIPHSRVYATGSNKAKVEKILELGIDKHFDNNEDVINQLGSKGELVKLSIHQRFAAVINFISNDNTRTK